MQQLMRRITKIVKFETVTQSQQLGNTESTAEEYYNMIINSSQPLQHKELQETDQFDEQQSCY
jgi:hypothetical protein